MLAARHLGNAQGSAVIDRSNSESDTLLFAGSIEFDAFSALYLCFDRDGWFRINRNRVISQRVTRMWITTTASGCTAIGFITTKDMLAGC
jgi:hypothetical protein